MGFIYIWGMFIYTPYIYKIDIPIKGVGGIGMGHRDREDINRYSNRVYVTMQITARPD